MAFTVEDGTGLENSNAYVSVAYFKGHHDDRGRDYSASTDDQIEDAIVKATDYVDARFGKMFKGYRQSKGQALEWPRLDAFDNDGFLLDGVDNVPRKLQMAVSEYAFIVLNLVPNEFLPNPARAFAYIDESTGEVVVSTGGQVVRNRDKVGPIESEQWYADETKGNSGNSAVGVKSSLVNDLHIPEYPRADLLLEELLVSSMSGIQLVRG